MTPVGLLQTRGHDAAVTRLRALLDERPPHALLLLGPAGAGVGTLARDAVALLLCAERPLTGPCGGCRGCRLVASKNHADLTVLGADVPAGIDEIRALAMRLTLAPMEGGRRVVLIEQASRLTEPAQHALLKLLEEPPANTHLILAGGDDRLLLPAIRSRCATLRLGLPESSSAVELLVARLAIAPVLAASLLALSHGRPGPHLRGRAMSATAVPLTALRHSLLALTHIPPHRRVSAADALTAVAGQLLPLDSTAGRPKERRDAATIVFDCARTLVSDLARISAGAATTVSRTEESELLLPAAAAATRGEWLSLLVRVGAAQQALRGSANPELLLDALTLGWPYDAPLS